MSMALMVCMVRMAFMVLTLSNYEKLVELYFANCMVCIDVWLGERGTQVYLKTIFVLQWKADKLWG